MSVVHLREMYLTGIHYRLLLVLFSNVKCLTLSYAFFLKNQSIVQNFQFELSLAAYCGSCV